MVKVVGGGGSLFGISYVEMAEEKGVKLRLGFGIGQK